MDLSRLEELLNGMRASHDTNVRAAKAKLEQRYRELEQEMIPIAVESRAVGEQRIAAEECYRTADQNYLAAHKAICTKHEEMEKYVLDSREHYLTWLSAAMETPVVVGRFGTFFPPRLLNAWKRNFNRWEYGRQMDRFNARCMELVRSFNDNDPMFQVLKSQYDNLVEQMEVARGERNRVQAELEETTAPWRRINEQIARLQAEATAIKEGTHSSIPRKPGEIDYLENVVSVAKTAAPPTIQKVAYQWRWNERPDRTYTLMYADSPVLQRMPDGTYEHIATTAKAKPFQIKKAHSIKDETLAVKIQELGSYDYVTHSGIKLYGTARDIAEEVFTEVRTGTEIFPEDNEQGYRIKVVRHPGEEHEPSTPRHWGQSHLMSLQPTRVTNGLLLGSGEHSKAYHFEHVVVVEANETGRATYFIDAGQFERLRMLSRHAIIEGKPDGYLGRVIHTGEGEAERQRWMEQVHELLQPRDS